MNYRQIITITYNQNLIRIPYEITEDVKPAEFIIDKPLEIGDKLILTKSGWILKMMMNI